MTSIAPVPRLIEQFERGLDAPICLTWELTYACNLACVHCLSSSGKRDPRELSTAQCKAVIDELVLRYVEALVYQATAENLASEQSARMVAMKSATDNAGNVIAELKLIYNKTRQAGITKELSEILAGAAAV